MDDVLLAPPRPIASAKRMRALGLLERAMEKGVLLALRYAGREYAHIPVSAPRHCPICNHTGKFQAFGLYFIRPDAVCPKCGSLERHRLLRRVIDQHGALPDRPRVLHFAPEKAVTMFAKPLASDYVTADLMRRDVDKNWNLQDIDCPDGCFDIVICSHILEHVDDVDQALREMARVLKPRGIALIMIPICEGLDHTYENPRIQSDRDRYLHFQQPDHTRLFGRDFRDKVRSAGFELDEYVAEGPEAVHYGLVMGERVFVATKPSSE